MSGHRLDRLIALSNDPSATDAERRLARERADQMRDSVDDASCFVECDPELSDAIGRAMARAGSVRSRGYRDARYRAAERRVGRAEFQRWRDRNQGIDRSTRSK